ncbi:hypothetical protein A0H81_13430 [Grifola frondosa]|uniref:EKC/KEOPS complex subunit CGI121 n=1 Tax=Grifola frondosa TaxID=5627 RepID=A0A1C7LP57_GRIFR|nr:hypothetical protein A0H81_13430 [Grifola frondosa]
MNQAPANVFFILDTQKAFNMETFSYLHLPTQVSSVSIALFTKVSNAAQLKTRLVQVSLLQGAEGDIEREAVNFAFIDARLTCRSSPCLKICSLIHLQTAIYQAILALVQGALRTKTVHSEILWSLNPSNNITEALRRYGVSDTTTSLFVVRVSSQDSDLQERMKAVVSGDLTSFDALASLTDWAAIKKARRHYYKLNNELALKSTKGDKQEQLVIEEIVTSSVAMKSVMA